MSSSNAQYTALASSASAAASAIAADPRFGYFQKLRQERLSQLRPLGDFFDKNRISRPTSAQQISQRLSRIGLARYVSLVVTYPLRKHWFAHVPPFVLACTVITSNTTKATTLITNLFLLITIIFAVGGLQFISKQGSEPLVFGGTIITSAQMYAGLIGLSIPLLWISSAGSTVFWIIGAAAVIIGGHAAFLEPSIEGDFTSGPVQV
ncbi:hypothetical protein BC936DRAFT_142127 [Jimgerdemannia flammicorona]|uniref:PRA1 family protein n=1 Tax=Jimgerdemannia flammicorona TaxID=994334 RepID=A0A433A112_9FUNG|nr:hypothetical protein BC936DRAFT_142127 [Jimgerdemannia flammicorona]